MNLHNRTPSWAAERLVASLGIVLVTATVATADVRLIESDQRHAVFEIRPPAPETTVVTSDAGSEYVNLRFRGLGGGDEPGLPDVPHGGFLVAVPPGTSPRLRVISESWSGSRSGAIRPVPERVGVRDPLGANYVQELPPSEGAAYRAATEFPQVRFSLADRVDLRGTELVRVAYAGAIAEVFRRTHRVLESAVVEVVFEPDPERRRPSRPTAVAPLDRTWQRTVNGVVLNARDATAWRRGGIADGSTVGNVPYGGGHQWKVRIANTELVEIPFDALAASSFPSGIPIDQVDVYQRVFAIDSVDDPAVTADDVFGEPPVPAVARDRNGNGVFDAGDGLIVYGRSFRDQWMSASEHEDLFDGTNYVWVRIAASGARMATSRVGGSLSGAPADSLASTPSTWFSERDTRHYEHPPDMIQGRGAFETDFYFWNDTLTSTNPVGDPPVQLGWVADDPFQVLDPVPGANAQLVTRVLPGGRGSGSSVHAEYTNRVQFSINGVQVGETVFYNRSKFIGTPLYVPPPTVLYSYTVPAANLAGGANTFTVRGFTYSGNNTTQDYVNTLFFFDWYELTYERRLRAASDQLAFSTGSGTSGNVLARVEDFDANDVWLFDVTDPTAPTRVDVLPTQIVPSGGQFDLRFDHDNAAGTGSYVATRESAVRRLGSGEVTLVPESDALASGAGATYVVVTHPDFATGADRLASFRTTRHSTHVATTQELYDLFGNGAKSSDAIRAFSAYAYHRWSTPIAFLCLIGDANEDHRRVELDAAPDLLPSHSLWADWEAAAEDTDLYYAQVTRPSPGDPFDEIPDLYVGRIAVNTPDELEWNVLRIERYETFASDGLWRRRVLFHADDAFSGSLGANTSSGYAYTSGERAFQNGSEDLAQELEAHPFESLLPQRLYMSEYSHPCFDDFGTTTRGDSCYTQYGVNCEADLGHDCGFWYDCRDNVCDPSCGWTVEYPCMRNLMWPAVNVDLREVLDNGVFVWNFQGHANKFFMTHEEVFRDDNRGAPVRRDTEALNNADRPFILLGWACHLNEFDRFNELVTEDCLAEKLMNFRRIGQENPGGAIASFASSGFEFLNPNIDFNWHVMNAFFYPERVSDATMPTGTDLPEVGSGGYVWTLGESTTRARILFWAQHPGDSNFRRAAERFVLLGDPALEPNVSGPELRVTVNGKRVVSGEFLDVISGEPLRVEAEAADGRGIREFLVEDTVLGQVPPEQLVFETLTETDDGVIQNQRVTYDAVARAEDYDVVIRALDANDRETSFRLSVRATLRIDNAFAYPQPFDNKVDIIYTLTSRGTGARLEIFTITGRKIWVGEGSALADQNRIEWNGRDESGLPVANGTYIVRLETDAGDRTESRTFPIVKIH